LNKNTFKMSIPITFIGEGAIENLNTFIKLHGGQKVLIVTDSGIAKAGLIDKVKQLLESAGIEYGIFDGCRPDALLTVISECARFAIDGGYDCFIGIGGGSVMDTSKVVRIAAADGDASLEAVQYYYSGIKKRGLPLILVPTTAGSGAEMSGAAVVTNDASGDINIKKSIYYKFKLTIWNFTLLLIPGKTG